MDNSIWQEAIDYLVNTIEQAIPQLETWAWAVFTCLFVIRCIFEYGKMVTKSGGSLAGLPSMMIDNAISGVGASIFVYLYFFSSFTIMEWFRQAGMALSSAGLETVDIGMLLEQRTVVTSRIDAAIESMGGISLWTDASDIPEIVMLHGLKGIVFVLYLLIALISVWVYANFCLGFLVGAVFIGGLAWHQSFQYGMRSISYVITSTQPLMLLAFMQGLSAKLIMNDPAIAGSTPATTEEIWALIGKVLLFLALNVAAINVPSKWLGGIVGSSGAPDLTRTASHAATGAVGMIGGAKMLSNASQSIGNRMLGGGGGGGMGSAGRGSSPVPPPSAGTGAGSALPNLSFNTGRKG